MLSEKTGIHLSIDQGVRLAPILTNETEIGGVRLIDEQVRYSLRFKPEDIAAVRKASQLDLPANIGMSSIKGGQLVLRLGPDEWLLISDLSRALALKQTFATLSSKFTCSVVDISHRNLGFIVHGENAENILNTGCPLDLSLHVFPVGKCTRTVYENTEIILLRKAEHEFHVEVWRSFAPYLSRFFETSVTDKAQIRMGARDDK